MSTGAPRLRRGAGRFRRRAQPAGTGLVPLDVKAWNPCTYRALTSGVLEPTLRFRARGVTTR